MGGLFVFCVYELFHVQVWRAYHSRLRYVPVTKTFLDSKILEQELLEASDVLTDGLMGLTDVID